MSNEMPKQGEFCWNELVTPNTKQATKFYAGLFGWSTQEHDMGEFTYTIFKNGDKEICGMMQIPAGKEQEYPPHWMSYVAVDHLESMIEKATSLGGELVLPATAAGEMGRFAIIKDPTGAHFSFWENAASA